MGYCNRSDILSVSSDGEYSVFWDPIFGGITECRMDSWRRAVGQFAEEEKSW